MMNAQLKDIAVEYLDGGVALIEMARPDRNNAFDITTLNELSAAFDSMTADPTVKAIVLAGRGRHFSTGASPELMLHLRDAPPLTVQDNVYSSAQGVARRIYNCRKPTIAAVSGAAVTLGCEFAIACDFRIIDATAMFQEAWVRLGLLPPLGGLFLLPRMVGVARAAEMVLQGRKIRAEEAAKIGLANELVAADALRPRAFALAAELGALPPNGYRLAKAGFHRGLESTMEAEWSANAMAQAILMSSEDFAEGVASVHERRPAVYTGR